MLVEINKLNGKIDRKVLTKLRIWIEHFQNTINEIDASCIKNIIEIDSKIIEEVKGLDRPV
jgi:hypothetical protein